MPITIPKNVVKKTKKSRFAGTEVKRVEGILLQCSTPKCGGLKIYSGTGFNVKCPKCSKLMLTVRDRIVLDSKKFEDSFNINIDRIPQ